MDHPKTRSLRGITRSTLALWLVLGVIALIVARLPSIARTQEGRVLETARQMQGGGVDARLVPQLNGKPRLQKPPLAYWLSDLAYNATGSVTAGTGRVPFVLAAWLTAGLNLLIGTRLFGPRAGAFAMTGVLGCLLVSRYGLLAETDVLTMLGVTAATYATWRGAEAAIETRPHVLGARRFSAPVAAAFYFHAAAIATALTILAKGPQGIFPLLFLIGWACYRRRWSPIVRWILCGAPLTLLVIAAPWFVYIFATVDYATITYELRVASLGGAHQGSFLKYFFELPVDALPFTGFVAAGVWLAARRCRRDLRLAGLLLWIVVILVPLCLAGQKQRHYLLPLMPPLMLLGGWIVDRAPRMPRDATTHRVVRGITYWTAVACVAGGMALPIGAAFTRRSFNVGDVAAGMLLLVVGVATVVALRRFSFSRATAVLCGGLAVALLILQNVWAPTLQPVTPRSIVRDIARTFGDRSIHIVGRESLPLMFEMRAVPGALTTAVEIAEVAVRDPSALFVERHDKDEPSAAPPTLIERRSYSDDGDIVRVFEAH